MKQINFFHRCIFGVSLLILCYQIGSIHCSHPDEEQRLPLSIISGLFMQKVESPLFYDSVVPMFMKYRMPNWENSDIILNETKCNSSNWFKGSSCPTTVSYHTKLICMCNYNIHEKYFIFYFV